MNIITQSTTKEIVIPRAVELNQSNVRPEFVSLVADAAICRIVKANGGDRNKLQPSTQRIIDNIKKAANLMLAGHPFTAYANYNGELNYFAMASTSRMKLYAVTESHCQCESHTHNGYCVHRTTRQLSADYFKIIRAEEDRAREYAALGIEVRELTTTVPGRQGASDQELLDSIPQEFKDMVSEMLPGFEIENVTILGPRSFGRRAG
jgi:hypothetical protein